MTLFHRRFGIFAFAGAVLFGARECNQEPGAKPESRPVAAKSDTRPNITKAAPYTVPPATPDLLAAAEAVAELFETHQFVCIGSTHGDAKIEEFLHSLITRPKFQQRVTDIVVEWAGYGNQRLLDRYLLELEPIAKENLAPIWLDTDHPKLWATLPQVRATVDALRDVNSTLAPAKRIRIVGGSEGVDWSKVKSVEDLAPFPFKTNYMEHLVPGHLWHAPGNRTLFVYGDGHIRHNNRGFVTAVDDQIGRNNIFVIGTIRDLDPKENETIARLGDPTKACFVKASKLPAGFVAPKSLVVGLDEKPDKISDYIDGVLYLGPAPDRDLRDAIALTAEQLRELERRASINSDPQRSMKARFGGRQLWFREHPNEFPARPK
jgi:hypothetical protein